MRGIGLGHGEKALDYLYRAMVRLPGEKEERQDCSRGRKETGGGVSTWVETSVTLKESLPGGPEARRKKRRKLQWDRPEKSKKLSQRESIGGEGGVRKNPEENRQEKTDSRDWVGHVEQGSYPDCNKETPIF